MIPHTLDGKGNSCLCLFFPLPLLAGRFRFCSGEPSTRRREREGEFHLITPIPFFPPMGEEEEEEREGGEKTFSLFSPLCSSL